MYYGEKVCLRALEMEDLDAILEHWNTLELRRYLSSMIPMSRKKEEEWLEGAVKADPWKDGRIVLAVEDKNTHEFLGTTSFFDISYCSRRAEFGIAIHNPENLGKGYGTDTTKVMQWVAFHILGLNSVYLYALSANKRAIRVYEKAGFKQIGIFRKAIYSLGRFHDFVAMDVLSEEFMEICPPGETIGTKKKE